MWQVDDIVVVTHALCPKILCPRTLPKRKTASGRWQCMFAVSFASTYTGSLASHEESINVFSYIFFIHPDTSNSTL